MRRLRRASAAFAISIAGSFTPAAALEPQAHAAHSSFSPEAKAFLAENEEAMTRMMAAMHVPPTGDVDRDFVEMMIPHHQGAIDMAALVNAVGPIRQVVRDASTEQRRYLVIVTGAASDRGVPVQVQARDS